SARSRYESDAWESLQSLGSRERAGGDAYGSRGRRRLRVAYGVASGAGLGLVAQDLATQRSARSRYASDAWDSHQLLGSRERAGGDAYGSRGRRRLRVAYGVASGAGLGLVAHDLAAQRSA